MTTNHYSRRAFLQQTAKAATATLPAPYIVASNVFAAPGRPGANDRIHIGVIGTGARGKYLIANVPEEGRVVAVCDCFLPRVADTLEPKGRFVRPLAAFHQREAPRCARHQDFRKMLDREKLDAVMIATSDHNHVLPAILACQAGMDVYVEKALSVTIAEGRALVNAVRRYSRVCQVGSQNRSMELNRFACQFLQNGGLGKISLVQLCNYPGPMRYEGLPEEPIPDGLAWDLFCGPTAVRPHNRKLWVKDEFHVDGRLWRGWDMWRSYAGHLMTNWGAHSVDMVQFALGTQDTGPVEVWPMMEQHKQEMRFCPVAARYANGVELRFELPVTSRWTFHGEHGTLFMRRNTFEVDPPDLVTDPPDPKLADIWNGPGNVARPHIQNWIDGIKGRGPLNAPVQVGHRSVTICHLANTARELRRKVRWDPQEEVFPGDDEANAFLDRPRRNGFKLP